MKNQLSYLDKLIKDLNTTSKYLKEDYIFNDSENDMPQEENYGNDMPIEKDSTDRGDKNAEEKMVHMQNVIQHEPIIQKIRQTAIDGLKKYSDDPTSSIYEFFKKVFLESDKVLTNGSGSDK